MALATYDGGGIEAQANDPWSIAVVEARARQQLRYVVAAQEAGTDLELRFVADVAELGTSVGHGVPAAVIADDDQRAELEQRFPQLPMVSAGAGHGLLPYAQLLALMAETEQICRQAQLRS